MLSNTASKIATKAATNAKRAFTSTSSLEARKFFVGGNWKCNGSVQQVNDLVSMLNQSTLSTDTEVVVCPSQVYVQGVNDKLRSDVAVGAQDVWTGGNGAYTGETMRRFVDNSQWIYDQSNPNAPYVLLGVGENTYAFAGICYERLVNNSETSVQEYFTKALANHQ